MGILELRKEHALLLQAYELLLKEHLDAHANEKNKAKNNVIPIFEDFFKKNGFDVEGSGSAIVATYASMKVTMTENTSGGRIAYDLRMFSDLSGKASKSAGVIFSFASLPHSSMPPHPFVKRTEEQKLTLDIKHQNEVNISIANNNKILKAGRSVTYSLIAEDANTQDFDNFSMLLECFVN